MNKIFHRKNLKMSPYKVNVTFYIVLFQICHVTFTLAVTYCTKLNM
jgi:hypothetical protein